MALASKLRDNQIVVIDELSFGQPRTKEMAAVLKALGLDGASALVATESLDINVYKSARNIEKVNVAPVSELNAYSVLTPRKLLVTKAALDAIRAKHGISAVAS